MIDPHDYWSELAAVALVGVGRHPLLPAAPPGPLAELTARSDPADPATALLDAAAATGLYLRAGALPPLTPVASIAPCASADLAPCAPLAASHLSQMLGGAHSAALPEWLAALAASGRRAPDARLPELLDLGRERVELRALIAAAIGGRGRWLAGLNPAWAYAATELASADPLDDAARAAAWETSPRAVRIALLRRLRLADPARARALVQATWGAEKADDRAAFVGALAVGLSMDDEPFLEAALDDRSKEVRAQVARLLAGLPASRLAGRMAARALAHVKLLRSRELRVELELPASCDRAMQRDGIEPQPPRGGPGERAWWLSQIVRRTPPRVWVAAWGLAPAAILALPLPRDWRDLLVAAWKEAALEHADADWAAALTPLALAADAVVPLPELIALLPAPRREALLRELLAHDEALSDGAGRTLAALIATPGPWGLQLGEELLLGLARAWRALARPGAPDNWQLRQALPELAMRLAPELAEEAADALPAEVEQLPRWRDEALGFVALLRFRRAMLAALRAQG